MLISNICFGVGGVLLGLAWDRVLEHNRQVREMRENCHHDFEELEAMGYKYLQCKRCKHQEMVK